MKKGFKIAILIIILTSMTACGSDSTKATMIDSEGNKVKITANELKKIEKDNDQKYKKYYLTREIEITSNIERISSNDSCYPLTNVDAIILNGGWKICLSRGKYDLSDYDKSTKLNVKGLIYYSYNQYIMIVGPGSSEGTISGTPQIEVVK